MRAIPLLLRVAINLLLAFAGCVAIAATPSARLPGGAMVNGTPQTGAVTAARAYPSSPEAATYLAASPITYSFSGTASGMVGEVTFTNASIVVDAVGDATAVSNSGGDSYCNPLASVTVKIQGLGSMTVTDPLTIFDTHSVQAIGLQRGCNTLDWIGMYGAPFATYDLTTAYGPAAGASQYVQGTVNTTAGPLAISSTGITNFAAQGGAVLPAPAVSLSPKSLAFGGQVVGTTSAPQTVTLTNTGNGILNIRSIATTTGDFGSTSACASTLAPGASCTIDVTFTPAALGTATSTLSVASDAAGSPHSVSLSGTGTAPPAPVASLTPTSLTYAARTVGSTSAAQTVTLANTGTASLAIQSIVVSGDYAFATACPTTLAPGASCTVDVTFTPVVAGARPGSLTISHSAAGSPSVATLDGTGLASAAPVADLSTRLLDFSAQPVDTNSAAQSVVVTNSGNATLSFGAITVTGDFFGTPPPAPARPPECAATLAPGASCQLAVAFHPTALNGRRGVLTIVTNAATLTVALTGIGLTHEAPQLSLPASVSFAPQAVGTRSIGSALTIRNTSPFVANLTELTPTGDFSVSDTCVTIAPGESCSVLVFFQPTAIGPREGTVTVRTVRDLDPYVVTLSGVGEENRLPALHLSATSLGFGNTLVGMPVTRDLTLRNAGNGPLVVTRILATGDFFSDASCVGTVNAGGACTLRITFLASTAGGRPGVVQILSNDPNSPHTVSLSGTGCFLPTPSRVRFGVLLCGS